MKKVALLFPVVILLIQLNLNAQDGYSRDDYLSYARASADWTWENQDSLVARWEKGFDVKNIFGYRSPSRLLEMASIYADLYEIEKKKKYAERAKEILLAYPGYRSKYPEEAIKKRPDYGNGVPALPDFFTTMRYIRPYDVLKRNGLVSKEEQNMIEQEIAHSLDYLLATQEWGPMNRTALRAETLGWAIKTLPDHPNAEMWRNYEYAIGFDNWGNWEIEDATIYHAVWLYALLGYSNAKDDMKGLFHTPEMFYYAQYFLNLMCPDGMIPDFGDAQWRANWHRYLVYFEAAAKAYDDPQLKWAAATIGEKFLDLSKIQNTGLAYLLMDCYHYGTDNVKPVVPDQGSMEVMEDMVGKKIVFRNGWDEKSTYMLLNYRDEGDGGKIFRDYLRDAIPVEEEKMTHGHADENSIVLMMWNGSVLLHDGGYRDYMPSGPYGAYRQDYFHNRICVRPEKIYMGQKEGEYRYSPTDHPELPGQSTLDFLHNAGSYKVIRTQKIDFITLPDFDYSRTRLIDDEYGYETDRVITYVKDPEMFVVFDIVKGTKKGFKTAANLWHTRKIIDQGEHWYDTQYDSLNKLQLNADNNLLIYFPKTHYRLEQVEKERRHYQDEIVISQTSAQYFELGQHIGFVTVLIPHKAGEDPEQLISGIKFVDSDVSGDGMSVDIITDEKTIRVGVKCDLRMDMFRDYRRPKYTYESGKIQFGNFESNGDFFFLSETNDQLDYTIVNLTKAIYDGTVLFDQPQGFFGLAFDGSPDVSGAGKARYWRGKVLIKDKR